MRREELTGFLNAHRMGNLDAGRIMKERKPQRVQIGERPVFLFDMSFDIHDSPIGDSISISQQPYGTDIPWHVHDYIEILFVYRGRCTLTVEDKVNELGEGDLILIDKFIPHTVNKIGTEDVVLNMILKQDVLTPSFLGRLGRQNLISRFMLDSFINKRKNHHYLVFRTERGSKATEFMENIMCELFDRDFYSAEIIDSCLVILFSMLIRSSSQQQTASGSTPNREIPLFDFLKYIEEHYRTCTLVTMGEHFGFHPNYLSALLKKATGKSFKDLLQLQRLSKAALFLARSDMPIPDIAEEVGYSSLTFFYKKFKELYLETPHCYREANRKKGVPDWS